MSLPRDSLLDLERQRMRLEENVAKLRKALDHWRSWEVEYEGVKEGLHTLKSNASPEQILAAGKAFGGDLVDEKEIKELLGLRQGLHRSKEQVVDLISRRVDYVTHNSRTVEKQLAAAEEKLDALLVVEQPRATDEEGLPLTEITEELDEDDNIISSTTNTPGSTAPQLLEVLKKVGVEDMPNFHETRSPDDNNIVRRSEDIVPHDATSAPPVPLKSDFELCSAAQTTTLAPSKPGPSEIGARSPGTQDGLDEATQRPTDVVAVLPTNQESASSATSVEKPRIEDEPIIPTDESPEDAALRRDMLQYGLEEVGAVVAELEMLDEDATDVSFDEEDEEASMASSYEEDEDQFGRSTSSILTEDYRKQMMELEKKLNAKSMQNLGPEASALPVETKAALDNAPSAAQSVARAPSVTTSSNGRKKKVSFADDLDIAPEPEAASKPANKAKSAKMPEEPTVPAVQDAVVERAPSAPSQFDVVKPGKKASRFKSARSAELPIRSSTQPTIPISNETSRIESRPPAPPEDKTLAESIVEHVSSESAEPPDADDFDDAMHRKEIATDYYKVRNRLVHRQGGFSEDVEDREVLPLPEEAGGPKKMSRFKAARLR